MTRSRFFNIVICAGQCFKNVAVSIYIFMQTRPSNRSSTEELTNRFQYNNSRFYSMSATEERNTFVQGMGSIVLSGHWGRPGVDVMYDLKDGF